MSFFPPHGKASLHFKLNLNGVSYSRSTSLNHTVHHTAIGMDYYYFALCCDQDWKLLVVNLHMLYVESLVE